MSISVYPNLCCLSFILSLSLYFSSLYICTYVYIPQFPKSPWDSEKGGETWWKKNFYVICLMQPDVDGAHMFCFIKIVVFIGGKIKFHLCKSIFLLLFFLEAEYLSNTLVSNTRKILFSRVMLLLWHTHVCMVRHTRGTSNWSISQCLMEKCQWLQKVEDISAISRSKRSIVSF